MRKYISLIVISILWTSCSVEKLNLSPLSNSLTSNQSVYTISSKTSESINTINYTSELSNLLSEFPIFSNKTMNAEIYKLKLHITDYLYAIKQKDFISKNDAYELYKKTFVNIQKTKDVLPEDEKELLNRFMAKVKTSVSLIESEKITE
ncbi:hypothetical protein GCM10010992_22840 [Cloacibacterium rupense]|uniref:Lipoprotein n=1 Tax=Cloacibacterium rupense TaxID=517423 RepID=A0ABQ2NS43_9FLAO|nr:hypothetical protein [Cloacibacterium rupense]GGP05703.1 hypothetical protein GCM10010992_22840 [Cloacibacterium rupense]